MSQWIVNLASKSFNIVQTQHQKQPIPVTTEAARQGKNKIRKEQQANTQH